MEPFPLFDAISGIAGSALAQRTFTVYNACPFTIWYVDFDPILGFVLLKYLQAGCQYHQALGRIILTVQILLDVH